MERVAATNRLVDAIVVHGEHYLEPGVDSLFPLTMVLSTLGLAVQGFQELPSSSATQLRTSSAGC